MAKIDDVLAMNGWPLESAKLNGNFVYKLPSTFINFYKSRISDSSSVSLVFTDNSDEIYKYLTEEQIKSLYNINDIINNNISNILSNDELLVKWKIQNSNGTISKVPLELLIYYGIPCTIRLFNDTELVNSYTIPEATSLEDNGYSTLPTVTKENFYFSGWYGKGWPNDKLYPSTTIYNSQDYEAKLSPYPSLFIYDIDSDSSSSPIRQVDYFMPPYTSMSKVKEYIDKNIVIDNLLYYSKKKVYNVGFELPSEYTFPSTSQLDEDEDLNLYAFIKKKCRTYIMLKNYNDTSYSESGYMEGYNNEKLKSNPTSGLNLPKIPGIEDTFKFSNTNVEPNVKFREYYDYYYYDGTLYGTRPDKEYNETNLMNDNVPPLFDYSALPDVVKIVNDSSNTTTPSTSLYGYIVAYNYKDQLPLAPYTGVSTNDIINRDFSFSIDNKYRHSSLMCNMEITTDYKDQVFPPNISNNILSDIKNLIKVDVYDNTSTTSTETLVRTETLVGFTSPSDFKQSNFLLSVPAGKKYNFYVSCKLGAYESEYFDYIGEKAVINYYVSNFTVSSF